MLAATIQGPIYSALNVEQHEEESLGIVLQQIGAVAAHSSETLSDVQIETLERIMPLERFNEVYNPLIVDKIKWNDQFDAEYVRENVGEVLKLWLELMPSHLSEYFEAYWLETIGFWHPYLQDRYGYIDLYIAENRHEVEGRDLISEFFGLSLKDPLLKLTTPILGSGALAWIMLISIALVLAAKKWRYNFLFYAPSFLCWVSIMIATPVAFSLRYVFILPLLLPLFFILPFASSPPISRS